MKKNHKNTVVIIKGAPGVGKTYISMKLASKLKNKKLAIIPIDEILHLDQMKLGEEKLILAKYNSALIARNFLKKDYNVIVDYTFDNLNHLKFFIDTLVNNSLEFIPEPRIIIYHLKASFSDVVKRNNDRWDGTDPLPESILKKVYIKCEETTEHMKDEIIIDTSKYSVSETVDIILNELK